VLSPCAHRSGQRRSSSSQSEPTNGFVGPVLIVWDSGVDAQRRGVGCGVWGSGCGVLGVGTMVYGVGYRSYGLESGVSGVQGVR